MPPHLAPMFHHTHADATHQNPKGHQAAEHTGMKWRFHNRLFYTNKGKGPFVLTNYRIQALSYKIFSNQSRSQLYGVGGKTIDW